MNIRDGNIFEAMRLVLPEHRALMAQIQRERMKRKRPMLTEERLEEMQYALSEALEDQRPVRVTLFHPSEDVVLQGKLIVKGNMLWIQTTTGTVKLETRDIIGIERV